MAVTSPEDLRINGKIPTTLAKKVSLQKLGLNWKKKEKPSGN